MSFTILTAPAAVESYVAKEAWQQPELAAAFMERGQAGGISAFVLSCHVRSVC